MAGVADLICVPYASLLNKDIRRKLKISINNSIIIFDEAHNLLEQEASLKSTELSYSELSQICERIDEYKQKYEKKMKKNNLFIISHLQDVCRALMASIKAIFSKTLNEEDNYIKLSKTKFFISLSINEIQLYKIKTYIELSNFDQKLIHFSKSPFNPSLLSSLIDFITSLMTLE